MKILMLGWEYPPHISGGLGTACQGLTVGLSKLDIEIDFVVPHLFGNEEAPHMQLFDACRTSEWNKNSYQEFMIQKEVVPGAPIKTQSLVQTLTDEQAHSFHIEKIPSLLSPYYTPETYTKLVAFYKSFKRVRSHLSESMSHENSLLMEKMIPANIVSLIGEGRENDSEGPVQYGSDLFSEVGRFTKNILAWAGERDFDLIHAHDWMTYPAGIALAKLTGIPLVVHVHSLEFDRSGKGVNPRIDEIERTATSEANAVIAVSYYTRSIIHEQHGVPLEKISVVHNGVYSHETVQSYRGEKKLGSKVVLFLGRITFQKGPDYFVEAAARVVPIYPDVTFVMAGSGDMLPQLVNRVIELGLSKHFIFTGFLKGEEVEQMFSIADLYIMPSVSEPFGISTLEAISHDIPVIISKQSGVSEVLNNALKVDFWDVDRLSNLIIGVLKYPEIREDIVSMAREEVRRLHWDAAAKKVLWTYGHVLRAKE